MYASRPAVLFVVSVIDVASSGRLTPLAPVDSAHVAVQLLPYVLPGDEALLRHLLSVHILSPPALQHRFGVVGDLKAALKLRGTLLPVLEHCSFLHTGTHLFPLPLWCFS